MSDRGKEGSMAPGGRWTVMKTGGQINQEAISITCLGSYKGAHAALVRMKRRKGT